MAEDEQIGRLALRKEGKMWCAYYAENDTMDDAIFLGSVSFGVLRDNEERKQSFITIMREGVSDIIEEKTGIRPDWGGIQQAPEHEKAGEA